jgi:hypothetical protein
VIPLAGAMQRFCSRVARKCLTHGERLHYLAIRGRRPDPGPFVRKRRPWRGCGQEAAEAYKSFFPDSAEARVFEADLICDHLFDLLGSGPMRLGTGGFRYCPLDWHRDFLSGYRWAPGTFYRDIRYGHIRGVDVKTPWELSRFQHLNRLGQAYVLTGRAKYREEFVNQIDDWIAANPVGFGVNWACTMDAAIRAANWLVWAECFLADGGLDPEFLRRFYTSLHEHGRFIRSHLERGDEGPANHYLADLVGLLFIAICCPFFRESRRWRRFCIRELARQMDVQVYADGCHFEASTCYHRLALELFFFAAVLVGAEECGTDGGRGREVAERTLGCAYVAKLHAMFVAVAHLLKPSGRMPQIGDNDSGRFLIFGGGDVLDMRYLLSLGAVYFDDPQLKIPEFGLAEDVLWVFGRSGCEAWNRLPGRPLSMVASKAFSHAGWFVIRRHPDYCLVSCGPNGAHGRGGHAHNDKLSIELSVDGRDVIVDPGTCRYTSDPDSRNRFRSTESHNTLVVARCEQAELPADLFRLPDRVRIRRAELAEKEEWAGFTGAIEYEGILHERMVRVDKTSGSWSVEDHISSERPAEGRIAFHLSPGTTIHGRDVLGNDGGAPILRIESGNAALETGTYKYSPEYGAAVKAECLFIPVPDLTHVTVKTVFSRRNAGIVAPPRPHGERATDPSVVLKTNDLCAEAT